MKPALKKTFSAILIALASLVIVIGIASLAMAQGGMRLLSGNSDTAIPTLGSTELAASTESAASTKSAAGAASTPLSGITATPPESAGPATSTPLTRSTPKDWVPIVVQPNQTLDDIASQYKTSPDALLQGNSLKDRTIQAGMILYVPLTASTTPTSQGTTTQCGVPAGWVYYYVQPGNTLYGIATAFGISVDQLMYANCLSASTIYIGQALYVPNVPPYFSNPGQPLQPMWTPAPTDITFPMLLTPQTPMLPTGIPFPAP